MKQLQTSQRIKLEDGREAIIQKLLGEGAQGAVYLVDINGERKALKWFRRMPPDHFINNLRKNIANGAPSQQFLWPEGLARTRKGKTGYVMPLKPEGSYEFNKFRLAKVRFTSFRAIIEAALNLCNAFRLLHAHGLSYQDLNDGGFFINPSTGEVAICDCDNVYAHGENSGILGKARFMAPEVVMGKNLPDSYSDRFSLTVVLFMLFCIDHPFEGFNVVKHPCLTEIIEQRLFGADICFIFNKAKTFNRPVRGVHNNVLTMWPLLPEELRTAFTEQFSEEVINQPQNRMTEMQWANLFISIKDHLFRCPCCGDETFVYNGVKCLNPRCQREITVNYTLEGCGRSIPLIKGSVIRIDEGEKVSGLVFEKPGDPDTLLIKNVSSQPWTVVTASGKTVNVAPNGFMPVKDELTISQSTKYKITYLKSIN